MLLKSDPLVRAILRAVADVDGTTQEKLMAIVRAGELAEELMGHFEENAAASLFADSRKPSPR